MSAINLDITGSPIQLGFTVTAPGTATPGGANTQVQFNDNGVFGGTANVTINKATGVLAAAKLAVTGTSNLNAIGNVTITGGTAGQVIQTNGAGLLSWQTIGAASLSNGVSSVTIPIASSDVVITANSVQSLIVSNTGATLAGKLIAASANITGTTNFGAVGNVSILGGAAGQVLQTNGAGNLVWATATAGGISNAISSVTIPVASGNVITTAGGVASMTVTNSGVNVAGTLAVTGTTNLNSVSNVTITGGSAGQVLQTNGSGVLSWVTGTGGVTNPASPVSAIQFNNGGVFGGEAAFTYDNALDIMSLTGTANIGNINATATANLGAVGNVKITGGTAGQVLQTNGSGVLSWVTGTGGVTNPASPVSSLQFNDAGVFGGNANLTYNKATDTVAITGTANIGNINATTTANLGAVGNVTITGGTVGQVLQTNGSGVLSWVTAGGGTGTSIVNGNSNVTVVANANVNISSTGVANVVVITGTGAVITGTLQVSSANISLGANAGSATQGANSIAIGKNTSSNAQGDNSIAIGKNAAVNTQGDNAIAMGSSAGQNSQGDNSVAIGYFAGYGSQGAYAIAIGQGAGLLNQGNNSIAIGRNAGNSASGVIYQANNSIIINATGACVNQTTANTFTVAPIRNDLSNVGNVLYYNTSTKEISYAPAAGGSATSITNGNSNVTVVANANVNISSTGVANVLVITGTGANIAGRLSVTGNANVGNLGTTGLVSTGTLAVTSANISLGANAGLTTQGANSVAIGANAAISGQGANSVAIGQQAGSTNQGTHAVAIGKNAALSGQLAQAVAIGQFAGQLTQGAAAIAIGQASGSTSQGAAAIAIGSSAANGSQGTQAIAIGTGAGSNAQGTSSVAIGQGAGNDRQGGNAIAIGYQAGFLQQANNSIALNASGVNYSPARSGFFVKPITNDTGNVANVVYYNSATGEMTYAIPPGSAANPGGANSQIQFNSFGVFGATANITWDGVNFKVNTDQIQLGNLAGQTTQGANAVAIGKNAGQTNQGANAVAIGYGAGATNQFANSIAINATGTALNPARSGLFVAPITNDTANIANVVYYNTTTKEMTYAPQAATTWALLGNVNNISGPITIALGKNAGAIAQGLNSIAIGNSAGANAQGLNSIAIGNSAAIFGQGANSVAIGTQAGAGGANSVSIGYCAGLNSQLDNAVAIGKNAGQTDQGANAVAIGYGAGLVAQAGNSIAINATGTALNPARSGLFVAPVTNDTLNVANAVYYNTTTKELTYAGAGSSSLTDIPYATEKVGIIAAQTGTYAFDIVTNSIQFSSTAAAANLVVNMRGNSTTTLNTVLSVGQSVTATYLMRTAATAYTITAAQIDGTAQTVQWAGAVTPTGYTSSNTAYTFTIIKTAVTPTYTVLGSATRYA